MAKRMTPAAADDGAGLGNAHRWHADDTPGNSPSIRSAQWRDLAHASALAASVFADGHCIGLVHPAEVGFIASAIDGRVLGHFPRPADAAHAVVLDVGRRA